MTATYTLDFRGNDALVPNAPDLSYVLACINRWKFPSEGLGLSLSRILSVINAWKFPVRLTVHFIDVGQGDSILLDLGQTEILVDGGYRTERVVDDLREYIDGDLEMMVATHPHADHIGGLIDVLQTYRVKDIWLNGDSATSSNYTAFMNAVTTEQTTEGASVRTVRRGDSLEVAGISFSVLNPPTSLFSDNSATNNNSVVLSVRYGEVDFLLMGDAEQLAERSILEHGIVPPRFIEVLKVGHHGSRTASSSEFLGAVMPQEAIISVGANNDYEHPHQETLGLLFRFSRRTYRTDTQGTIKVITDGRTYAVQTAR